jgi:two-component system, NtrC family, sensor histidine kinase AtoS
VSGRLLRPFREWTLGAKLASTFFVVVAGVAALVSVSVIRHERAALDAELRKRGVDLVENLARLSVDLVLQDDLWGLYKVVRDIARGSGDSENVVVYAMVLDPAGRVLAHSDPARYPMGERLPADSAVSGDRAIGATRHRSVRDGDQTLHDLAAPIVLDKQPIGIARVGITPRYLEATVARITRDILLITSALGALGVTLGFVISRRMTRPLRELAHAVDRIGAGRLDEPITVTTTEKDEIGRLADRFTVMAQRLRENVREIQETKHYLENLLETANDFIYTLDTDGRITYVNRQFLALGLGREDLVGKPLEVLLGPAAVGDPGATGAPSPVFEVEVQDREGRARTLVVTETPLRDGERGRVGTLGIAKDVTERKELETRLIKSERLASIGELAGALAHEIRNPLGAVVASAKMLSAESPQAADYDRIALLRVITDEARRLDRILSDFLDFARPRVPLRQPHSLNGLVGEVVGTLRFDHAAREKAVETRLDPTLPPVPVDADQIKQVLWNVVRNALEATEPAGTLRIATAAEDGHVVVEVEDFGAGIPPERQARLFEPFQTTKRGGAGLGLAIAHRIVAAHHGAIDVTSEPGAGTRVRIRLPRASAT